MKTSATIKQLNEALNFVNKQFDDNIKFKTLEQFSKNRVSFTLTVKDSSKLGAKRSAEGRRIAAACWHVHGYLFKYLFSTYPDIKISTLGKTMYSNSDNWQDQNVGSNFRPEMFSEACECN